MLTERAFQLVLGRSATEQEIDLVLLRLQAEHQSAAEAWAEVFHALFGSLDFRFVD